MTPKKVFARQLSRDRLHERVEGVPVPHVKMMNGASAQHDRAPVSIIATLASAASGKGLPLDHR